MLSCKQCFGSTDELVDGLCFTCSPINMVDWFNAKDGDNNSDQQKADLIVMQEKLVGLAQTISELTNKTCSVLTKMESSLDKLDEDLKREVLMLAQMLGNEITRNKELCERLKAIELNLGIL